LGEPREQLTILDSKADAQIEPAREEQQLLSHAKGNQKNMCMPHVQLLSAKRRQLLGAEFVRPVCQKLQGPGCVESAARRRAVDLRSEARGPLVVPEVGYRAPWR